MQILSRIFTSDLFEGTHLTLQKIFSPCSTLVFEERHGFLKRRLCEQRTHPNKHLTLWHTHGHGLLFPLLLSLCLRHRVQNTLVRREFEMVRGKLFRTQHLRQIGELLVHVQRIDKSFSNIVDWVLTVCQRVYRYLILFEIKVCGDGCTTDICWSPSKQTK